MKHLALPLLLFVAASPGAAEDTGTPAVEASPAQDSPLDAIAWVKGPGAGPLGSQATVQVPDGYVFADAGDTRTLMELMQNPTSGNESGFLAPADLSWFVVFEYDDTGYVSDAEKNNLDPDAILESIRQGTEEANKLRREKGWGTLTVEGWETKPAYNPATNNVEWATRFRDEKNNVAVNHNIRLLGRKGVMSAVLVANPAQLAAATPLVHELLASGYAYNKGNTYAEYRQGDKIAKYGLVGLITGGAAVVAAKSGLLKHLWKIIVVGVAAIGAAFKKFFGRKPGGASSPEDSLRQQ